MTYIDSSATTTRLAGGFSSTLPMIGLEESRANLADLRVIVYDDTVSRFKYLPRQSDIPQLPIYA